MGVNSFAQDCYPTASWLRFEPGPSAPESSTLTTRLPSTSMLIHHYYQHMFIEQKVVKHNSYRHTHPFNGPLSGTTTWTGTKKVKPIWISLKQETVSGSGISWAICKSAPHSEEITMPATHHRLPNQQRQSTEGNSYRIGIKKKKIGRTWWTVYSTNLFNTGLYRAF